MQSLQAKAEQFAAGLTPEEAAQIRSMQHGTDAGDLSPALRARAQQTADGLTAEEKTQFRAILRQAGEVAGVEGDTLGQMIKEPRVEPTPDDSPGGGGGRIVDSIGSKIWEHSGMRDAWRAIGYFL